MAHLSQKAQQEPPHCSPQVRFALVSYRDHPPQEKTYVTRVHGFTEEVEAMREFVNTMQAGPAKGEGGDVALFPFSAGDRTKRRAMA